MFDKITKLLDSDKFEVVDEFFNRMGFGSIATSLGLFFSELPELDVLQWAAIVSLIGGLLFCIEKCLVIYIRLKDIKQPHKEACKTDTKPTGIIKPPHED